MAAGRSRAGRRSPTAEPRNAGVFNTLRVHVAKRRRRGAPDIWARLEAALDPGLWRPKLAEDVEVAHFATRWGGGYTMVKSPRGPTYFRLSREEGRLIETFDGRRTVREIVVDSLQETGSFDAATVTELVELLYESGFLERPWVDAYKAVRAKKAPPAGWRARLRRIARSQTVQIRNVDRFTETLYRRGGRFAFTRTANLIFAVVAVAGAVVFGVSAREGRFTLSGGSLVAGAGLLFLFDLGSILVHEAGHALAIRHSGRRVNAAGFQLYLGHPAFFIDSADILMSPERDRMRNAWAGPYSGLVIAGLCSIIAFSAPGLGMAPLLYRFAVLTYLTVLINLIPFLELDGYWILMDALQTTDLRPRSLAFLRHDLPTRIRERRGLTRYEWALLAFGVVGALFTVLALVTSWWFWGPIFSRFVRSMWRGGLWTRVLVIALGVVVFGPILSGLFKLARALGARARFAARRLRFLAETHWRREAGELITALPLTGEIPPDDLDELAGRVALRRYAAGQAVVRRGEAADGYYVVRNGRLAVIDDASEDGAVIRAVTRGQAFGELALFEGAPRAATVRAETAAEVFFVDKGTFDRLLSPHLVLPELAPSLSALAEVWSLAPFRHLGGAGAAKVAEAGEWVSLPAGEVVVREGRAGDFFFVVDSGQLEVLQRRTVVRTLRSGDHFGEVALLLDVPRTATVRAHTPVRLFRLGREAFVELVASSFRRGALRASYDREGEKARGAR